MIKSENFWLTMHGVTQKWSEMTLYKNTVTGEKTAFSAFHHIQTKQYKVKGIKILKLQINWKKFEPITVLFSLHNTKIRLLKNAWLRALHRSYLNLSFSFGDPPRGIHASEQLLSHVTAIWHSHWHRYIILFRMIITSDPCSIIHFLRVLYCQIS